MSTTTIDLDAVLDALGGDLERWACQCHGASARIVKSGVVAPARVARGFCDGVVGQHSWVVLGMDCYDEDATIIDPTLWSYDDSVEGIWVGTMREHQKHVSHGTGSIWEWGKPDNVAPTSPDRRWLDPVEPLSDKAKDFLRILGPLDSMGWAILAHAPVQGWPSSELLAAIDDTFPAIVPIDIIGMNTDRNPKGLYLKGGREASKIADLDRRKDKSDGSGRS